MPASMASPSTTSPAKQVKTVTFTIPASTSLHLLNLDVSQRSAPESTSSFTYPFTDTLKPQESGIKLACSTSPTTTSPPPASELEPQAVKLTAPQLTPTSRHRTGSVPAWSPSLLRKLRWRLRRYTLWEAVIFCSFIGASVVFFAALAGVGYVPSEPATPGWHAPGQRVSVHARIPHMSVLDLVESFLRFSGLRSAAKDLEDVPTEEEEEGGFEPGFKATFHLGHERPRFGAWRPPRHRMTVVREPSVRLPTDHHRRMRRQSPWAGQATPPLPHHGSFHERLSQLIAPERHDGGEGMHEDGPALVEDEERGSR